MYTEFIFGLIAVVIATAYIIADKPDFSTRCKINKQCAEMKCRHKHSVFDYFDEIEGTYTQSIHYCGKCEKVIEVYNNGNFIGPFKAGDNWKLVLDKNRKI